MIDKDLISSDQGNGSKQKKTIRDRLFYTIHHLLLFKEINQRFGSILIAIHYLQVILLTFNNNNEYIYQALNNLQIAVGMDYLQSLMIFPILIQVASPSIYLTSFIVCCSIISILAIGFVIFNHIQDFQNIRTQQTAYYMGIILEISNKILFIPFTGILLLSFRCDIGIFDQCFGYTQIIISILGGIYFIIFIILQYLIETFFFVFAFKTKDSYSRAPSNVNVISLLHKIFAIFLTISFYTYEYSSIYGIYHIMLGFLLLNNFLTKIPFFNDEVSQIYGISISIYIWTNCCLIFCDLIPLDMVRKNILVLIGVGIIYFCNLIMNTRSLLVKSLTIKDANEITNDVYLDSKIRLLFKLTKESESESTAELLLASLMRIHADKCIDQKCPCKDRTGLFDSKKKTYADSNIILHKDFTFIKHFIYYMIKTGCLRFQDSKLLTLDLVYYLFEAMRNYPWAYVQLSVFKKKQEDDKSVVMSFLIYRLEYFLSTYLNNKSNKSISSRLKFEYLTVYDDTISKFRQQILQVINNFISIWDIIDAQMPDLQQLNQNLANNLQTIKEVKKTYCDALTLNSHSMEIKVMSEIFANYIIYDEIFSSKVQDDITMKNKMEVGDSENIDLKVMIKGWDMYDEKCFTMEISSQYEKIGLITSFSRNAPKLTGFNDEELRNQNISIILPKLFQKGHYMTLCTFFETGYDKYMGLPRHLFGVHKLGQVFSINLIVKVVPTFDSFKITALVHVLNDDDYIIMDEKGEIDCFGSEVQRHTNITHDWIKTVGANIQMLAPKTIEFFEDYWSIENNEEEDQIQASTAASFSMINKLTESNSIKNKKKRDDLQDGNNFKSRKFYIFIPQNFQKISQRFHEEIRELQKRKDALLGPLKEEAKKPQSKKAMNKIQKEIEKVCLIFKESYGRKLEQYIKKFMITENIEKVIKVRASIQTLRLFHSCPVTVKVFKIHSYIVKSPSYVTKIRRLRQEKNMKILSKFILKASKRIKLVEEEDNSRVDGIENIEDDDEGNNADIMMDKIFNEEGNEEEQKRRKDLHQYFSKPSLNNGENMEMASRLTKYFHTQQRSNGSIQNTHEDFYENREKGKKMAKLILNSRILQKRSDTILASRSTIGANNFESSEFRKKDTLTKGRTKEKLGEEEDLDRFSDRKIANIGAEGIALGPGIGIGGAGIGVGVVGGGISIGLGGIQRANNALEQIENETTALKSIFKKAKNVKIASREGYTLLGGEPDQPEVKAKSKTSLGNIFDEKKGMEDSQIADWLQKKIKKKVQLARDSVVETTMKTGTDKKKMDILNTSSSDESQISGKEEKLGRVSADSGEVLKNEHEKEHVMEVREKLKSGQNQHVEINRAASVGSSVGTLVGYKNISRYLQEALDRQEVPFILRLSNISLYLLILIVISGTFINTLLLTKNYETARNNIISIKTPCDYGFDLLIAFDSYLDFQLKANNILDDEIYNNIWIENDKMILRYASENLYQRMQYEVNPANVTRISSSILYDISSFQITIQNKALSIDLNFEKFISLVVNAINQTISYNLIQLNSSSDEFVFILRNNFESVTNYIDNTIDNINSESSGQIDFVSIRVLLDLLLNVICIFLGFLVIFPVNMKARLAIESILVLFTKLSKRDTEFYSRHYKMLRLTWNSSSDNHSRLARNVAEDIKSENSKENSRQATSHGRSTMYKGMRSSYVGFLIGTFVSLSIFIILICLRNIPLLIGINKFKSFSEMYISIATIPYDTIEIYEGYKVLLSNSIINQTNYNYQYFQNVMNWIDTYRDSYVLPDSLYNNNIAITSDTTSQVTENFMFEDICQVFQTYLFTNRTFCTSLTTMLNQGFRGFDDVARSYFALSITTAFDTFSQYNTSNMNAITNDSMNKLNHPYLQDYKLSWLEMKNAFDYWLGFVINDLIEVETSQLSIALKVLIAYFILLIVFVITVWRWQYATLEQSIKRTNEYFTLIPNNLLKENQYIRLYLQRTLGVKALNSQK